MESIKPVAADLHKPTHLVDRFGRQITYVHMSITDRCDFRCIYCINEKTTFLPPKQLLTLEELARIGQAFVELGVTKIRVTGGEPLVHPHALSLFQYLGKLPGLRELVITTNGSRLARMAQPLREAGVKRVNISLDSLKPERFQKITRYGDLCTVLQGIDTALKTGFEQVKLNAVILRNHNHDEVIDLLRFAIGLGIDISFIEEMPLGVIGDHERASTYYSSDQVRQDLSQFFTLLPTTETTGGPSKYYHISGTTSRVGFISPHSHNFCASCNRVRVTTIGRLLLCLGQEQSLDLRPVLRQHPDTLEPLKQVLIESIAAKPQSHDFDLTKQPKILRHMNMTGG